MEILERSPPHQEPNLIFRQVQISKHGMRMKNSLNYLHQFVLIGFLYADIHYKSILFFDPLLLHKELIRAQTQK